MIEEEVGGKMESFAANRSDAPSRCTYILHGDQTKCLDHLTFEQKSHRQDAGIQCNVLTKLEYMDPGGSIKDRIGLCMIEQAERNGSLKSNDTIIESTAGNTGVGLVSVCAIDVPRALGAEIVRTPTIAPFDLHESDIAVAHRSKSNIPNSHILDQYRHSYNSIAHYDTTAEEIFQACNRQVDMIVVRAGICNLEMYNEYW
ncbi:unnamed protein product [Adineta ricciae]|uniref:Tryptophan synthase beta chain-like PALP domain-containing protein n=1 Tax=Adineta ricciae TaxID=249248 RepID=A0A814WWZ2_ADIRI|nr:unnamed protein product [Adineta ricciae]